MNWCMSFATSLLGHKSAACTRCCGAWPRVLGFAGTELLVPPTVAQKHQAEEKPMKMNFVRCLAQLELTASTLLAMQLVVIASSVMWLGTQFLCNPHPWAQTLNDALRLS
mmetsp:Transcript_113414/g.200228  ORF Transcript_113414/g.200228 Transcript_113414/m.200228 type:complete len:110 (-) Transcript_113414:646-975(-)